ncbi:MAG: carboxypeptidase regulatory-like domain-containing protein, partial [Planctomycetota bacterium]
GRGRALFDFGSAEQAGGTIVLGDVVLHPGRSIEGRLLDERGEPVARTPVTLIGANADRTRLRAGMRRSFGSHGAQENRVTDDLGRFRFPDLAPGNYTLHAQRPHSAPVEKSVVLTDAGDLLGVEIRFEAQRELTVTLLDPDGKGVPDAWFIVQHEGGTQNGKTDSSGRARMRVKGTVKLLQLNFITGPPDDVAFQLPVMRENIGADVSELTIHLKRAGVVRGVVLLPDGKPCYKPLLAVRVGGAGGKELRSAFGNDDGSFRAEIPLDASADLVFKGFGRKGERSVDLNSPYVGVLRAVTPGATGVTMRLRGIDSDRSLTVRVLTPDGRPMKGIRIFTQQANRFFVTDEDGRYTFTGLLAREATVQAFPDDRNAAGLVPPVAAVVVPEGQEIEMRFRKGTPLLGSVSPGPGEQGHIYVVLYDGKRAIATANCDKEGRFELLLALDAGNGPFRIQAIESRSRTGSGTKRRNGEIDGVTLDGPEPRIELR